MAEYTQKQWDALSSQRQFMQRRRIPSSRPIITDIQSIVKPRRRTNNKAFEVKKGRAVPGRTGIGGFANALTETSSGGGLAWPLVETENSRAYYPSAAVLTSSDGLFVLEMEPLKTLNLTDGAGTSGQLQFDNPYD